MDGLHELRRFIDRELPGLEVAPYFNPVAPRAEGFRTTILDVFDTDRLRELARGDPNIPDARIGEIEAVDIVADASGLAAAIDARGQAGHFGWIVSSHNFEHLPDPIRFLQGCAHALRPGGMLSMAIPDGRACFDHFRMPTTLADWLSAHHEGRRQPAPATRFDMRSNLASFVPDGRPRGSCRIERDDPRDFVPVGDLREAYATYLRELAEPGDYIDTHCSVLFGEVFELLLRDLIHLGLVDLEVVEVTETRGHVFFAHLRKPAAPGAAAAGDAEDFVRRRRELLHRIGRSLGAAGFDAHPRRRRLTGQGLTRFLGGLLGADRVRRLRAWNRARRAQRRG